MFSNYAYVYCSHFTRIVFFDYLNIHIRVYQKLTLVLKGMVWTGELEVWMERMKRLLQSLQYSIAVYAVLIASHIPSYFN